jgi:hypothetical protein
MKNLFIVALVLLAVCANSARFKTVTAEKDYTDFVTSLASKIKQAPWKNSAYDRLAYITDSYGPRMWGSMTLEQVIY